MARDSQDISALLHQHAAALLEALPDADALVQTARSKLLSQLAGGEVGLGTLARSMHMSERTLRRRLSERGTSYQALLDELRSTQARTLIGHGAEPVDRIAQRLGFADTSSFFHAFKRWTGQTPAQFRRTIRADR
jgi:AraC-like DNA-binding protein